MTKNTITVAIYTNRNQLDVEFPARWVICSHCSGNAKTSSHLGAFTSSEWRELDDEFKEDYVAGYYDQPCEPCKGLGRVQVIDEEKCTGWRKRILLNAYYAEQRDDAEYEALRDFERRMGA